MHEEVKTRLNLRNACCHSLQNLLSSFHVSKNLKVKIHKIIIFHVVLYRCKTWSLTIREEHRLRLYEKRVLRRTFGHKREEVAGGWRRLDNEELHYLFFLSNIVRLIK
jgi:hypothetical protein